MINCRFSSMWTAILGSPKRERMYIPRSLKSVIGIDRPRLTLSRDSMAQNQLGLSEGHSNFWTHGQVIASTSACVALPEPT